MIEELIEDEDWTVRYGVAVNSNAPTEVLRKLVEDNELTVRIAVSRNPSTPVDILRKLAEDENSYVWESAKSQLRERGQ